MKRLLVSTAIMALSCLTMSHAYSAADMVNPNDTMPVESVAMPQKKGLEIGLKIEALSDDQLKSGLSMDELRAEVVQNLQNSGISLNDSMMQPILVLRVRTIQSGLDYATFFQLSLQEESMLVRNRSTFSAITWSQASLLSCRPEELKKEVMDTVQAMSLAFAKDFTHALQGNKPAS